MKRVWVFVIIGLLLLSVFFIIGPIQKTKYNQQSPSGSSGQDYPSQFQQDSEQNQQPDENCQLIFSQYLIDPKYVQKIGQVGVVHGGGKSIVERSYISVKQEFYEQEIPIYAPADMKLIAAAHYKVPGSPENALADYVLKFNTEECNVEFLLGHLKGVIPSIDQELPNIQDDSRENFITPIEFKAGDLIGYYKQQSVQGAVAGFDFVVRDPRVTNQFINQERYEEDRARNLIHGVCPYDYFTQEKKQEYYNLLGGAGGKIFTVKDCGTASRDKSGTISGMWFLGKEIVGEIYNDYKEGDYGSPISLVGDEESVTFGNFGQSPTLKVYSTDSTYKLPIEVTTEHCYKFTYNGQDMGYAYFKIIDESTMDVSYSSTGSCPSTMPAGAKRYYK